MITLEFLTFATHVASQISSQYFTPPLFLMSNPDNFESDILNTTVHFWEDLLKTDLAATLPSLGWLEKFLIKYHWTCEDFAKRIYFEIEQTKKFCGSIILWTDARYPENLKQIPSPPLCLFARGNLEVLRNPCMSVVGSRKASPLAVQESFRIGFQLATQGYTVVSGGAFGCDIASHHGVLASRSSPSPAISIFAGGLSELYPRHNHQVFSQLLERGGLFLSERLWTAPCFAKDFPIRNRIISGLSKSLVVMQAAERSGAMVTARFALDQGRDVFVLQHPSGDIRSVGSESLIFDGAMSFQCVDEFVELTQCN